MSDTQHVHEVLRDIRHLIDMDLRGPCMRDGCTRPAEFQIRALDSAKATHDDPVLLCERCLRSRLNVDLRRWQERYGMTG